MHLVAGIDHKASSTGFVDDALRCAGTAVVGTVVGAVVEHRASSVMAFVSF